MRYSLAALAQESGLTLDIARTVQKTGLVQRSDDGRYSPHDVVLFSVVYCARQQKLSMQQLRVFLVTVQGALDRGGWDYAVISEADASLVTTEELIEVLKTGFTQPRVSLVRLT